jgi:hypothetical protein
MKNPFTGEKKAFFAEGHKQRQRLILLKDRIKEGSIKDSYPHFYIYSPPGLGKSHTINAALEEEKISYERIMGNISMWAFGVTLATINFKKEKNEEVIFSVDDCDVLFKDTASINIMKNVLEGNKCFHYQKNLTNLSQLDELQQQAIKKHMKNGQMGFKVPTDKFRFIFTSNLKLPTSQDPESKRKKIDLLAIRDRVRPIDFDLQPEVQWGWICDIAINTNAIPKRIPRSVVLEACNFMFDNWSNLTTQSVRTIKQMCDDYLHYKSHYKFIWTTQYLN